MTAQKRWTAVHEYRFLTRNVQDSSCRNVPPVASIAHNQYIQGCRLSPEPKARLATCPHGEVNACLSFYTFISAVGTSGLRLIIISLMPGSSAARPTQSSGN